MSGEISLVGRNSMETTNKENRDALEFTLS